MGFYPYDCEACSGAYYRCGADHSNDETDCSCESEECKCEDDTKSECSGGQFCWENAVVCKVIKIELRNPDAENIDELKTLKVGDILYGEYDGYGSVNVEGFEENQIFTKGEYGEDEHEDDYIFQNYALVNIWCYSCWSNEEKDANSES